MQQTAPRTFSPLTMQWQSMRLRSLIGRTFAMIVIVLGAVVISVPLVWVISTSLKAPGEVYLFPPRWIPETLQWQNYVEAWTLLPFNLFLRNSLITTLIPTVAEVFVSALVGYSFARLRWRARDTVFMLCVATMMLPYQVTMIPRFILFKQLNWIDTFYPLIVPSILGGGAFHIFLVRQFMLTLPVELEEAARIDGCSTFQIWRKIILPLSKPVLTVVAVFAFMNQWREFLMPLIYLNSQSKWTIMLGLVSFQDRLSGEITIHLMMAISFLTMLPCLILFFSSQPVFVQGIALTGIKG